MFYVSKYFGDLFGGFDSLNVTKLSLLGAICTCFGAEVWDSCLMLGMCS